MLDSIVAMNFTDTTFTNQQQDWADGVSNTMAGQAQQVPSKNTLFQTSAMNSNTSMATTTAMSSSNVNDWKPQLFPFKMYDLLEDAEAQGFEDVVSWTCNGTAFKIHNRRAFEKKIMPSYFPNMNSYKSFRRQLNFYGIYQDKNIQDRPDNAYSHEFFVRGQRYLCEFMERRKQGLRQFSKAAKGSKLKPMESQSSSQPSSSSSVPGGCTPSMFHMDTLSGNDALNQNFTSSMGSTNMPQLTPTSISSSNIVCTQQGAINKNVFQSFMNQDWEDLPFDMTPKDVVSEIIDTFRME